MPVRLATSSVALLCLCIAVAHATLSVDHVQLGEQRPGRVLGASAIVENDSATAVTISGEVRSSGDRIRALNLPLKIGAHASAELKFDVHVDRLLGKQVYYADFSLDNEQKNLRIAVNLFVDSAIDGEPMTVDLGLIKAGTQAPARRVDLSSRDLPDLHARTATDQSKLVDAEIVDDGKAVVLRNRQDAPWGKHDGWIEIATTSTTQPTAWIKYSFETRGRVVPETYAVSAGLQHVGNVQSHTLFIRDTEGAALELGKITQRGAPVVVIVTKCPVNETSCRSLELKIDDAKVKDARFSSELTIDLPQYSQKLVVKYFGLILPAESKIVDLNAASASQASDDTKLDLKAALGAATQPELSSITMPIPEGHGPLLGWDVENEQQIYGYIVYRADGEGAPMRRMNEKVIRTVSQKDNVPVKYYWRDDSAQPGRTYWYQIGTVDQSDVRADLTPRVKKAYSSQAPGSR